jgi:hypothetical protein
MTILTTKLADGKDETAPPEVVTDYSFLVQNEKNEGAAAAVGVVLKGAEGGELGGLDAPLLVLRRRRQRSVWLTLISLLLLIALTLACICLYKNMLAQRHAQFDMWECSVTYHDDAALMERLMGAVGGGKGDEGEDALPPWAEGQFDQEVEVDLEEAYERIKVPTIGDTRRATILHDFNVNYTAIIDKEQGTCFLMPLNRSLVLPPRDFWDLLVKLKSGYYVPDTHVVREDYRVVMPAIADFDPYGAYIAAECRRFDSYTLVKEGEPYAMAKRAVCPFTGESYCMGEGGVDRMLCFKIKGCR